MYNVILLRLDYRVIVAFAWQRNMNVRIEKVGLEASDLACDMVLTLLRELGEEAEDLGVLEASRVRIAWQRAQDRIHIFFARDENADIVGIAAAAEPFAIFANGEYGIINEMHVLSAHRSRGVGKRLLDEIKRLAQAKGWSRIDVVAPESKRWVRTSRFYEREGFTFAGANLKFNLGQDKG